jgi:hypothetical protein
MQTGGCVKIIRSVHCTLYKWRGYVNRIFSKMIVNVPEKAPLSGLDRVPRTIELTAMANNYRHRFDFDIGYLVKSPCRECIDRRHFPGCMDSCLPLDKIRTVLANSISCSRSYSALESHAIFQESEENK